MKNPLFNAGRRPPIAIVLGTNDIASAVAVSVHRARRAVILAHDCDPPAIRRTLAFHDVLYGEAKSIEGIGAQRCDRITEIPSVLAQQDQVAITRMGLTDLLVLGGIDVIIDARMQKHAPRPDFRGLAQMVIGLGPGFCVGRNCDLAVETKPLLIGALVEGGATEPADGIPECLSGAGRERFVYAPSEGIWRTPFDIGGRVYKGMPIGHIDAEKIYAPIDGVLRGIARDGTEIPEGVKLVEVDPRIYRNRTGRIEERPRLIADATLRAIRILEAKRNIRHAFPMPGIALN